ncbi:MAG: phage tail tape measure protein [Candidatus Caldarchaeum sp.]
MLAIFRVSCDVANKSIYQILIELEGSERANAGLQALTLQAGIAGTAIGAIAFKARDAAIEYDSALAKFNTIASEATGTIDQQREAFDRLTVSLGNTLTATEALNAGYEVLSSGYSDLNDVTGILEASQKAALGGFSDLRTVADAATTVLNVYGDTFGEVATVTQKTNTILSQAISVQNLGKITIDQYARSIGVLVPTAKAANVSLTEVNAAVALATSRGIAADTAIRGYRQALVNLIKPTDKAAEAARAAGIEIGNAALQSKGYSGVIADIIRVARDNPGIISQIFTDVDSLNIANVLIGNSEALAEFTQKIEELGQSGILQSQFEIIKETDAQKQQRLLNQLNEAFRDLGIGVVNTLEPLIEILTQLVANFNNLPQPVKESVGAIALLTSAALGFTATVAGTKFTVIALKDAITKLGISAGALAAQFAVLATATFFATQLVNSFQNVQQAAANTQKGVENLRASLEKLEQFERLQQALGETKTEAEEFEKRVENVTAKLSPFNRFIDQTIRFINGLFDGLIKLNPGLNLFLETIGKVTGFELPKLATSEDAALTKINTELLNLLDTTGKVRDDISKIDPNQIPTEELTIRVDNLKAAKDALLQADFTTPEQKRAIDDEIKIIDSLITRLTTVAESRGASARSSVDLAAATQQASEAEAEFLAIQESARKAFEDKARAIEEEIKLQEELGQITGTQAVQARLENENELYRRRLEILDRIIESEKTGAEERARAIAERDKLETEQAQNQLRRQVELDKLALDGINRRRELAIAQAQASGESEIEVARRVLAIKQQFAEEERRAIESQIATTVAGSERRLDLEIRLAKLTSDLAREREALAKKEADLLKAQVEERLKAETAELEAQSKLAEAGGDKLRASQAELELVEKRLRVIRDILSSEQVTGELRQKILGDLSKAEADRVRLNREISTELTERQVAGLRGQLQLAQSLNAARRESIRATSESLSAQSSLLGTLSSALDSIKKPLTDTNTQWDSVASAAKSYNDILEQIRRENEDKKFTPIEIPRGATEAQRKLIEAENERRARAKKALDERRRAEDRQRQLAEAQARVEQARQKALEEDRRIREERVKAERQLAVINRELAQFGIQINNTGNVGNAIEEAKVQIQLIQLENQRQLNELKLQEQLLSLENTRIEQEAAIAEANLRLQSGNLNEQETKQAELQLQLAQNRLNLLKQQQANLNQQAQLTQRNLSVQEALARSQSRNPATRAGTSPASAARELTQTTEALRQANTGIVDGVKQSNDLLNQLSTGISRLESVSNGILSATQRLPGEIARSMPRPVVPK